MNRSFDEVMKSAINNSRSKESHAFPKSARFRDYQSPVCIRDSYDLSPLDMTSNIQKKMRTLPQQQRFGKRQSLSPGPCSYNAKSFLEENRLIKVGPTIDQANRLILRDVKTPGPGSYSPKYCSEKNISVTMSPRFHIPKINSAVGPGDYMTEKYDALSAKKQNHFYSKYQNSKEFKIGEEKRFKQMRSFQITPGPDSNNPLVQTKIEKCSFGKEKKRASFLGFSTTPGPGQYNEFSQFAQRRRQLAANLQKMSQLVGRAPKRN